MDDEESIWNSFLISFAMFSKIPVPRADWDKENMKYMICFFPADRCGDRSTAGMGLGMRWHLKLAFGDA